MLKITPIPALKDNYIWLIVHPNTSQCVIIDPGEAKPVLQTLAQQQLTLSAILITHHHWDHTGGIADILSLTEVPIYGPAKENIPGRLPLQEGDQVKIDSMGLNLKVLDIPGHTLGHLAYMGHGMVFTGDTLFTGGCGRVFEGTPEQMLHSLNKLAVLPDETLVYCGHEYTADNLKFALAVEPNNPDLLARNEKTQALRRQNQPTVPSSLALEKKTNPFLRTQIPAVIKAAEAHYGQKLNNSEALFTVLREWKNNFAK